MTDRVLITGAWGYVGGRLVEHLSRHEPGLKLRTFSRSKPTGSPPWASRCEIALGDIQDSEAVLRAAREVDVVVHLAALNEIVSEEDPLRALAVNTGGTLSMLLAARSAGVRRFIFLSTFHVYGLNGRGTVTESTPAFPVHPYALTHKSAEDFVAAYGQRWGVETAILRLSNGFGWPAHPGVDRWTLVVNDLCRQAVRHRKLVLKTSGTQLRDFVTLEDVARAIQHFVDMPSKGFSGGVFNLGGGCVMSILDMATRISGIAAGYFGVPIPIETPTTTATPSPEPLHFSIDRLLGTGFQLRGSLDEEILKTLQFCEAPGA